MAPAASVTDALRLGHKAFVTKAHQYSRDRAVLDGDRRWIAGQRWRAGREGRFKRYCNEPGRARYKEARNKTDRSKNYLSGKAVNIQLICDNIHTLFRSVVWLQLVFLFCIYTVSLFYTAIGVRAGWGRDRAVNRPGGRGCAVPAQCQLRPWRVVKGVCVFFYSADLQCT